MTEQSAIRSQHRSVFINWLFACVLFAHICPSFLFVFLLRHQDFIVLFVDCSSLSDLILKELFKFLHYVLPIKV
jgi:hypothetical protein